MARQPFTTSFTSQLVGNTKEPRTEIRWHLICWRSVTWMLWVWKNRLFLFVGFCVCFVCKFFDISMKDRVIWFGGGGVICCVSTFIRLKCLLNCYHFFVYKKMHKIQWNSTLIWNGTVYSVLFLGCDGFILEYYVELTTSMKAFKSLFDTSILIEFIYGKLKLTTIY